MHFVNTILRRAFSRPRGAFGRLGGMVMARGNQRMARQAIQLLDVRPGNRVLEVGFGPGVGIQHVANTTQAQWVAGIDPSREMLEQAQTRNATDIEAGRVALWRGPVAGLPFDNAIFDKALVIRSMQLWPDAIAGLREIRRVLRPTGCIVLGFTHHCEQTPEDVAEMLGRAGFAGIRTVDAGVDFFVLASKPDGLGEDNA